MKSNVMWSTWVPSDPTLLPIARPPLPQLQPPQSDQVVIRKNYYPMGAAITMNDVSIDSRNKPGCSFWSDNAIRFSKKRKLTPTESAAIFPDPTQSSFSSQLKSSASGASTSRTSAVDPNLDKFIVYKQNPSENPEISTSQIVVSYLNLVNRSTNGQPAFWTEEEDRVLLQVVQGVKIFEEKNTILHPAQTPNWDLCSQVVSTVRGRFRSARACEARFSQTNKKWEHPPTVQKKSRRSGV